MRTNVLVAALLGAALLHTPARADEGAEREARALFAEGAQHIQGGDYAGALALFQRSHALYPSAKTLLNIGTLLRQLGRDAEAADAYDAYARDPAADPAKKAEVEKLLSDLEARVGKLRVVIDGGPATVRVDGKVVGAPASLVVVHAEPGLHSVSAQREGGPPAVVMDANATAGSETLVPLKVALAAPEPVAVLVGPVSTAPPSRGVGWTLGIAALGVGGASLVAGAATGAAAMAKRSSTVKLCPTPDTCPSSAQPDIDAYDRLGTASTATFVIGGALAATGVVLMVTSWRGDKPAGRAWISPVVGPGVLGARGAF